MDIILIPGLWLDGSSWDAVTPTLEEAGHDVQALTLPGMQSRDADRSQVTLADQVDAVVAAIDRAAGPVLLVGHSLGAAIGHSAVDARPDKVARAVYVGGFPSADGERLLDLPAENGEVPMPDWAQVGEEANIVDFDEAALGHFYASAIPAPEQVLAGPVHLSSDERRFDVPVTAVCPEYTADDLRAWVAGGDLPELARVKTLDYVDLPGGHWPQLTQPEKLAAILLDAAEQTHSAGGAAARG